MTFRTSDLWIGGSLIIIGLTEVAHLAGCLFGWSFLSVANVLLAEVILLVLAAVIAGLIGRKKRTVAAGEPARIPTAKPGILRWALALLILVQLLLILTGKKVWTDGDMTLETVHTFLKENGIYTVNPLTGAPYTQGMPFRLKMLCLPTLYAAISRWTGMAPEHVVYRLIPCITLLLGYVAYGRLAAILFEKDHRKRDIFLLAVGILYGAGTYMPGVDGFDLFYGGFRGVTIRAAVLLPYLIVCLAEKKYFGAVLCILAEACMVWTLYGAGVCLPITAAWVVLELTVRFFSNRHTGMPGEEDAE